jgi:hypothetical protein
MVVGGGLGEPGGALQSFMQVCGFERSSQPIQVWISSNAGFTEPHSSIEMRVSNPSRGNNLRHGHGREHRSLHVAQTTDSHILVCAVPLTDKKTSGSVPHTGLTP